MCVRTCIEKVEESPNDFSVFAVVWSFSSMYTYVILQLNFLYKGFKTFVAMVRFIFSVKPQMH